MRNASGTTQGTTIGIVTKNRCEYLGDCLSSILGQGVSPLEVIVFDDGSTDGTQGLVRSRHESFQKAHIDLLYLHTAKSICLPYGRNRILENSKGGIVAFVDDDVVCPAHWLGSLEAPYTNPLVAGVGGPAIRVDRLMKPVWPEIRRDRNMNTINRFGELRDYSDNWVPPRPVETQILRGANMSYRRSLLLEVGGFDERYFGRAFLEDVDLAVRILRSPHRLIYDPKAFVFHRIAPSGGARLGNRKADWFSVGFTCAHFIKKNYRKTWILTMLRLLLRIRFAPVPLPRILQECFHTRSMEPLWAVKGYVAGFRGKGGSTTHP